MAPIHGKRFRGGRGRSSCLLFLAGTCLLTVAAWNAGVSYGRTHGGSTSSRPSARAAVESADKAGAVATPLDSLVTETEARSELHPRIDKPQQEQQRAQAGAAAAAGSGSAAAGAGLVRICSDACPRAKNGVCDDGRPGPGQAEAPHQRFEVHCDLGTDCSDCGAFDAPAAVANWRPVAEIRAKNITLFTKASSTPRPFYMGFTDPKLDIDVSRHYSEAGVVERGISRIWVNILEDGCRKGPAPALVLDVGANFGWYSLLAASHGCRVLAWEPVPWFAAFTKYGLLRSSLSALVTLREAIVSDAPGTLEMKVPQGTEIWGTASVSGLNLDLQKGQAEAVSRPAERVDAVVDEAALIMKADIEGYEPMAFRSARRLLLADRIENIVLEYSPGVAERNSDWKWYEKFPALLLGLARAGYTVLHLTDGFSRHGPGKGSFADPLPPLMEVTAELLKFDIEDARLIQEGHMGCEYAKYTLGQEHAAPPTCGPMIPEGLSPYSFRCTFAFNTNIWAFKHRGGAHKPWEHVGPLSSCFPLNHTDFFTPHSKGMGMRPCEAPPDDYKVAHRCHCANESVCGEVERTVARMWAEGKLRNPKPAKVWDPAEFDIAKW